MTVRGELRRIPDLPGSEKRGGAGHEEKGTLPRVAARHSLLALELEDRTPAAAVERLTHSSTAVREIALRRLSGAAASAEILTLLRENLEKGDPSGKEAILAALAFLPREWSATLLPELIEYVRGADPILQRRAACVIGIHHAEAIDSILPVLHGTEARILFEDLGRVITPNPYTDPAGDPAARLLDRFLNSSEGAALPVQAGTLVSPRWLAGYALVNPPRAEAIARSCGYIREEDTLDSDARLLLDEGMMIATPVLAGLDAVERLVTYEALQALLDDRMWGAETAAEIPDLRDPAVVDLFLGSARHRDRRNIAATHCSPFAPRRGPMSPEGGYHIGSYRYCRSALYSRVLEEAARFDVPQTGLFEFIVDNARAALMPDEILKGEAAGFVRTKFRARARGAPDAGPWRYPVESFEDAPFLHRAVISPRPAPHFPLELSAGARSVLKLLWFVGREGEIAAVSEAERRGRALATVGVELQITPAPEGQPFSQGWKQALRYFGLRSPRRPELGTTVEAVFRPVRSWSTLLSGISALVDLGVVPSESDTAFHLSLGADLGPDVRYIAFPQLFLVTRTAPVRQREGAYSAIARLMSKGFACRHADTEPCGDLAAPPVRTEVRSFLLRPRGGILPEGAADDLRAVQLLGTAVMGETEALREVGVRYRKAISDYVDSRPRQFRELLDSDWYECTGSPYEAALVPHLRIIQAREAVRAVLRDREGLSETVRHDLAGIRSAFCREINDLVYMGDSHLPFTE